MRSKSSSVDEKPPVSALCSLQPRRGVPVASLTLAYADVRPRQSRDQPGGSSLPASQTWAWLRGAEGGCCPESTVGPRLPPGLPARWSVLLFCSLLQAPAPEPLTRASLPAGSCRDEAGRGAPGRGGPGVAHSPHLTEGTVPAPLPQKYGSPGCGHRSAETQKADHVGQSPGKRVCFLPNNQQTSREINKMRDVWGIKEFSSS